MGTVLNLGRFSGDFRYKILKPMFVNFLMATNVFDMPASLFARYLEFFDIETATPMQTWGRRHAADLRGAVGGLPGEDPSLPPGAEGLPARGRGRRRGRGGQ